jgi:hypothetical protein
MLKIYKDTGLIKVLDPRHPLFGGEFRLLETIKFKNGKTLCVIELRPGIRRRIPIEVTDRGESLNIPTLPIDIASLVKLCETYRRGETELESPVADESSDNTE